MREGALQLWPVLSIIDITPLRRSVTLGSDPIATTNGSSEITITDVNNGAEVGDYITISGATTTNGINATALNTQFVITEIVDANTNGVKHSVRDH